MGRVLACALVCSLVASRARARESGFQADGAYALVNKDVNGERWAMTYDTESGVITGNVFPTDGGPPKFVVCEVLDEDESGNITADCKGADACTSCPCTKGMTC